MKTERRHELQTNKLADWTGHQIEQLRPHSKLILGAVILGVAVIITAIVLIGDSQAAQAAAWNDYYMALAARDRDALVNVAKTHGGTAVALWSKQSQGDMDLSSGIAALYTNRDEGFRLLNEARQAYLDVIERGGSDPELIRHSLLGVAQASEAIGDLDKARDYYQKAIQQAPDSAVAVQAKQRLEDIKNTDVEKWYSWFARQRPKPAASRMLPNLPGMPDDLTKLPDKPEAPLLPLPSTTQPAGEATGSPTKDDSKEAQPGAGEAKSSTQDRKPIESKSTEPKASEPKAATESKSTSPSSNTPAEPAGGAAPK